MPNSTQIHNYPHISLISPGLFSEEQLTELKMVQENEFEKSKSYLGNNQSRITDYRTSNTFHSKRRFSHLIPIILTYLKDTYNHSYDISQAESIQLTTYEIGQQYKPHNDFFNYPGRMGEREHDRQATVIMYLNDDFHGGTTDFINLGIKIKPITGALLYFTYFSDMPFEVKNKTFHQGALVTAGTKKIATLWLH